MSAINTEIAYLEYRLAVTILQRDSASGDCSRASHDGLVELYRYRLAALRGSVTMPIDALIEQAQEAAVFSEDFETPSPGPSAWETAQPNASNQRGRLQAVSGGSSER